MSPSPAAVSAALHPVVQARCSYTSLVYQDKEAASSQTSRTQDLVRCLVEWLVRLEEERKADHQSGAQDCRPRAERRLQAPGWGSESGPRPRCRTWTP